MSVGKHMQSKHRTAAETRQEELDSAVFLWSGPHDTASRPPPVPCLQDL